MSNDEIKKIKDKEREIKRIKTSFEKQNWEDKEKSWIKGQNKKKIKLTKKKNQRKPISNEPSDNGWNLKTIIKNNWSQPNPTFSIL